MNEECISLESLKGEISPESRETILSEILSFTKSNPQQFTAEKEKTGMGYAEATVLTRQEFDRLSLENLPDYVGSIDDFVLIIYGLIYSGKITDYSAAVDFYKRFDRNEFTEGGQALIDNLLTALMPFYMEYNKEDLIAEYKHYITEGSTVKNE